MHGTESVAEEGMSRLVSDYSNSIELMKVREASAGAEKEYTISELLQEVSKTMDTSDKDRIDRIKRELKWK